MGLVNLVRSEPRKGRDILIDENTPHGVHYKRQVRAHGEMFVVKPVRAVRSDVEGDLPEKNTPYGIDYKRENERVNAPVCSQARKGCENEVT